MELQGLFTKIIEKLDKQSSEISEIKIDIAKNTVSLDEHIKRTALLEESMENIRNEVKPIQKHVDAVHTVLKLIGFVAVIAGAFVSIIRIIDLFK
jgi:hypothetical protein